MEVINRHDRNSGKEKSNVNVHYRFGKQHRGARRGAHQFGNAQAFEGEKELAKLASEWPGSRLVDAGVAPFTELKPVKKFTDRKSAVARIWAAIQRLTPHGAQPARDVAPEPKRSKKAATKAPRRTHEKQGAKGAEERTNKKAEVLAMMKRARGATLSEIMEVTSWQAHTVRGFVNIVGSKGG